MGVECQEKGSVTLGIGSGFCAWSASACDSWACAIVRPKTGCTCIDWLLAASWAPESNEVNAAGIKCAPEWNSCSVVVWSWPFGSGACASWDWAHCLSWWTRLGWGTCTGLGYKHCESGGVQLLEFEQLRGERLDGLREWTSEYGGDENEGWASQLSSCTNKQIFVNLC